MPLVSAVPPLMVPRTHHGWPPALWLSSCMSCHWNSRQAQIDAVLARAIGKHARPIQALENPLRLALVLGRAAGDQAVVVLEHEIGALEAPGAVGTGEPAVGVPIAGQIDERAAQARARGVAQESPGIAHVQHSSQGTTAIEDTHARASPFDRAQGIAAPLKAARVDSCQGGRPRPRDHGGATAHERAPRGATRTP